MLKDHEKFISFIALILAIIILTMIAILLDSKASDPAKDIIFAAKLRILDIAIGGLLTIGGMAAQALFRVSSIDTKNAETAGVLAQTASTVATQAIIPAKVEVTNTEANPVHTKQDEDLPPMLREQA